MDPTDLEARLAALEHRAPGGDPPVLLRNRRRSRLLAPLTLAPIFIFALVATAAAGGAVIANLVQAYPGVQNPGQPLEGANLECMTPPDAAAYLQAHGFTNVVWQVETGTAERDKTGQRPVSGPSDTVDAGTVTAGDSGGASVQQSFPPDHGYVIPGAMLSDGRLIMVVDQREGATGVGACYGMPMP